MKGAQAYNAAIVRAGRAKPGERQEHPFYYDTVWDLWRLVDLLQARGWKRIGMFGISMGGIQTWLAASVDDRVAVEQVRGRVRGHGGHVGHEPS